MVQNSRTALILSKIILRIILICITLVVGFYTSPFAIDFLNNILHYQQPSGFFGYSLADWGLGLILSWIFLGTILFGSLGKKVDYIIISLLILLGIWEWSGTENITLPIWFALIGTILVSNLIGFVLKLLRQRVWPQFKV